MSTKKSTADRILDAVVDLYIEQGREGVSVRQITESAECSNTTVLNIFKNKQGLIEEALRRELATLDLFLPSRSSGSFEADLVTLAESYLRFFCEKPFVVLVLADVARQPRLQAILKDGLENVQQILVWWLAHHPLLKWRQGLNKLVLVDVLDEISTPFFGAILYHVLMTRAGVIERAFDPEVFVQRFLEGWGSRTDMADPTPDKEVAHDDS